MNIAAQEEPVYSKKEKLAIKQRDFREYLVDKEVVLAIVKCNMIGLSIIQHAISCNISSNNPMCFYFSPSLNQELERNTWESALGINRLLRSLQR